MDEACCTCASLLRNISPQYDEKTEKLKLDRRLECCGRVICGPCTAKNPRFATYCPFCQVSTTPSPLPQGLRDPPAYTSPSTSKPSPFQNDLPPSYPDELPSYSSLTNPQPAPQEKEPSHTPPHEDVLHFLDHSHDNPMSLSLRYGIPITAFRKANNLTSDNLLLARRTVVIPGEFYKGGVSLSPRPVEGEDEERRKAIVRRWQVACKVCEYDVALLYLEQVNYDLEAAIEAYKDDEQWKKDHPMEVGKGKSKTRHSVGKRRFTGQRS